MYILNGGKTQIVNSEFVERFSIVEKDDASLIVASYSTSLPPVTLARYKDTKEAKSTLNELYAALMGRQAGFDMPDSRLHHEERIVKDARTKRRGGS